MRKQRFVHSRRPSTHSERSDRQTDDSVQAEGKTRAAGKSIRRWCWLPLMLVLCLFSCDDDLELPIQWTRMTDFPGTPRASGTAFSIGQKAYVCFGRSGPNSGLLNDVWEYDAGNDTWARKTDFPGPARVKAVAGVINGKAYVGLGAKGAYESTNLFKDWWEYDPETDTWTSKATFPDPASNDLSHAVINGKIYVTGGFDGQKMIDKTYCFDPVTDTWTQLADIPGACIAKSFFAIGDYLYAGSGYRGYNIPMFYRYNTTNDTWKRISNLPRGRILSSGLALNGKGYVMLGRFWNGELNNGRLLADVVEYDPVTDTWTPRGNFTGGARQNAVTFVIDSVGYVLLGESNTERKRDVWKFVP